MKHFLAIISIFLFTSHLQALPEAAQLEGTLKMKKQVSPIIINIEKIGESINEFKYMGDLKTNCELCVSKNNLRLVIRKKDMSLSAQALIEENSKTKERYLLQLQAQLSSYEFEKGDRINAQTILIKKLGNSNNGTQVDSGSVQLQVVRSR